ncbi:hypothetical protein TRFO_13891 [Tritrichomonas foetus]|uniref:Protein kinase domain-containing protein n=1 Tax=Tritrichomonas foetus TaxID=1144522 RepID=A0A1J4KX21_9EUKA|nr:hypothetical protein TRFO_13891 [Tritrichomonas foetus]|eukprot:OHT15722.1 hypothetical protein TRFO_13891 [Tritrichomonas foetus]
MESIGIIRNNSIIMLSKYIEPKTGNPWLSKYLETEIHIIDQRYQMFEILEKLNYIQSVITEKKVEIPTMYIRIIESENNVPLFLSFFTDKIAFLIDFNILYSEEIIAFISHVVDGISLSTFSIFDKNFMTNVLNISNCSFLNELIISNFESYSSSFEQLFDWLKWNYQFKSSPLDNNFLTQLFNISVQYCLCRSLFVDLTKEIATFTHFSKSNFHNIQRITGNRSSSIMNMYHSVHLPTLSLVELHEYKSKKLFLNTKKFYQNFHNISKCIVPCYGIIDKGSDEPHTLVLKFMLQETYYDLIDLELTNTQNALTIMRITSAIDFLHSNNYCHLNIKPDVIHFDCFMNAYLGKLGTVWEMSNHDVIDSQIGTTEYSAPERREKNHVSFECDIYSLGKVLAEIFKVYQKNNLNYAKTKYYKNFKKLIETSQNHIPIMRPNSLFILYWMSNENFFPYTTKLRELFFAKIFQQKKTECVPYNVKKLCDSFQMDGNALESLTNFEFSLIVSILSSAEISPPLIQSIIDKYFTYENGKLLFSILLSKRFKTLQDCEKENNKETTQINNNLVRQNEHNPNIEYMKRICEQNHIILNHAKNDLKKLLIYLFQKEKSI